MYERLTLTNYGGRETVVPLTLGFEADFRDMFEVRGSARSKRGQAYDAEIVEDDSVSLHYEGLDQLVRRSTISFSRTPQRDLRRPRRFRSCGCRSAAASPSSSRSAPTALPSRAASGSGPPPPGLAGPCAPSAGRAPRCLQLRPRVQRLAVARACRHRAADDRPADRPLPLCRHSLVLHGLRPRRRHLRACKCCGSNPALARGVLAFLAQHQATETSPFSDSQPGKIMHETRKGEMAVLRELPFGRYYGGVDTTPLYIYLADRLCRAHRRHGLHRHAMAVACRGGRRGWRRPAGRTAAASSPTSAPPNPGFPTRAGRTASIPSSTPTAASRAGRSRWSRCRAMSTPPIAGWPSLAARRGEAEQRRVGPACAERMRAAVEAHRSGWRTAASTRWRSTATGSAVPGALVQCRASALCRAALAGARASAWPTSCWPRRFHSGWGVRTLADDEMPFNPMSYHNGSIWPHDTAICAAGMARYGERDSVVRLMSGTFEAAVHFNMRLPELFCGFDRSRRAKRRSPIRSPACPRHGRPAPSSC